MLAVSIGDGSAAVNAKLNTPYGLEFDSVGNAYIADSWNYRVRKVSAAGIISTFAGNIVYTYLLKTSRISHA